MAHPFQSGNYYVVRFTTGGYGNRYTKLADAIRDAQDTNRYNERKYSERIVREVVQYRHFEEVKTYPV